jgi:pSer/pThr/pTyr-binding forkhead associated (FHA) protein
MAHEIQVLYLERPAEGAAERRFPKERVRIGRCRDNDVAIEGDKLSRYHAELFIAGGKLRVKDLGSRNGTWVNGSRVAGEASVEPSDVLVLGEGGPAIRASVVPLERANPGAETLLEKLDSLPVDRSAGASEASREPEPRKAIGQSTLMLAMDAMQAEQRSRTQKIIAFAVAAVTFVVLVVVLAAIAIVNRSSADSARHDEELRRLEEKIRTAEERSAELEAQIEERDVELDQLRSRQGLSESERAELIARTEGQLSSLRSELRKSQEAMGASAQVWADLVERYKESIFLCVSRSREGSGFGTAFAVREDGLLATNAHVALLMKPGAETLVIQNGTGKVFTLEDRASSSEFTGPSSPDVGLLKIATGGARLVPLPLAADAELARLRIGTQLGTIGFPGELGQTYFRSFDSQSKTYRSAVATFKDGWIGAITNYRSEVADFKTSTRIQHSASLTGGTSGSPMFTADGKVVALNNSSLDIVVPRGGQRITTKSAAQIGYAVRVDELRRFMKEKGW